MKIRGYIAILFAAVVCATTTPSFRLGSQNPGNSQQEEEEPTFVDMKAGRMRSVKIADTSVVTFVGNPIFHHNGAVITCDSAVRHTDRIFEWFGNVIINKDSTYIYGDRVYYNGNTAEVFSPLVKMIDGETVLYTYNFIYDTKTNVGEYYGGGTISQGQTLLESNKGFYYGDIKDFICVGKAELRDTTYQIRSDSLGYNTDTEVATFFTKSYIWNEKGEILSADEGLYYTADERYNFYSDAYIMTETREMWADDIDYRGGELEDAVMKRNIQIRDEEQKVYAFGDYGLYFGKRGEAMLTERPSLVSFDTEQGDSLFMRADSIFIFVVDSMSPFHPDSRTATQMTGNSVPGEQPIGEVPILGNNAAGIIPSARSPQALSGQDIAGVGNTASIGEEQQIKTEGLSGNQEEESLASVNKAENETAVQGPPPSVSDSLSGRGNPPMLMNDTLSVSSPENKQGDVSEDARPAKAKKEKEPKLSRAERRAQRKAAREEDHEGHDHDRTPATQTGRTTLQSRETGSTPGLKDAVTQSFNAFRENLALLEAGTEGPATESGQEEGEEETQRVMVAYNNVKIYRSDFQAVCDSMVSFTIDSTTHLYIEPVMWNGENQIKSDEATIFTKNEQLDRALFVGGNPVMSAKLDAMHFNQITGKTIEAFFKDNDIYRTDAIGNGITYYYMQDDETRALQGFLVVESADISFYIADQMIDSIIFRGNPDAAIFPMDKIPDTQDQRLPQFKWEVHRKPTQIEVFDRAIRPSRREEYESLPLPQFPLTLKIDEHRKRLLQGGTWRDRTDDISPEAHEFVNEIQLREEQQKSRR